MQPNIHLNLTAIIVAVIANFVLGFLWYTPLFGKIWAKEMGFDTSTKPPTGAFVKGILFNLIGNFLLAFVFFHDIAIWYPQTWGLEASADVTPTAMAFMGTFFTWLGFFLPVDLNTVGWEMKSWKLFFINTVYHFLSLLLVALIITHMGGF